MSKKYIHYGNDHYDRDLFYTVQNTELYINNKPLGGMWSSPVDAPTMSWYDWCMSKHYKIERLSKHFVFELKPESKILYIRSMDDVRALPKQFTKVNPYDRRSWSKNLRRIYHIDDYGYNTVYLDFEEIVKAGYDAIEYEVAQLYWRFYGWDVDSLLVLNPDCIIELD